LPKIPLDKLEPGMKIAKPVRNASGMVLLGENTDLTAELIDRIKTVGIDSVYIHGTSKPTIPMQTMLSELDERFRLVEKEPHMDFLKKVIKEHIERLYE
jgi:UDP-N-acetylmuramyl pentapeptide synthase